MSKKLARSRGDGRGTLAPAASSPQSLLAGGLAGTVRGAASLARVASQPVDHEERKPRAGCERLPVIVCVLGPHSSSKRPAAGNMSPSQHGARSREASREAEVFKGSLPLSRPQCVSFANAFVTRYIPIQ